MKRKLFAIILCLSLMFAVIGCGDDTDNTNANGETKTDSVKTDKTNSVMSSDDIKSLIDNADIDGIDYTILITEDNDPNGSMGKAGEYVGGVFFVSDFIDESDKSYVLDDDWNRTDELEIGCDNGGTIEIFATEKEAKERDDYLAGFDGTLFASGHMLYKNMVIRTSDKLKASQQTAITEAIISALS